jgi:hypothetical protein
MLTNSRDIKYTIDGEEILITQHINGSGYIVRYVYEDGPSGKEFFLSYPDVYEDPPIKKLHSKIEGLNTQIQALLIQKDSLESSIMKSKENLDLLAKDLEQYNQVQVVFDFAKGEITHFVDIQNFNILDLSSLEYDNEHVKMIGLTGRKDRLLEWRIYRYSDGSGSSVPVIPCRSKEEAIKVLANIANKALPDVSSVYIKNRIAASSLVYGYNIPDSVIKEYHDAQREGILKMIKEGQIRLEKTQKEIEKLNNLLEVTPA